jgi:peptidoglycan/xylan/chitin deacetylase (PgdA/CDA1 family)
MPIDEGSIPVFCFHDVNPEAFTQDLTFLRENGYQTLTTDEFVERRRARPDKRAVLLTFDDASRNFWDVTFPLLRQFEMRATLFAPTHWMTGASAPQNGTGLDVHSDRASFMSWSHVRACDRSGLVDVQSHAHRHALVYTSARLVNFASPALLAQHPLYDWPMRRVGSRDVLGRPPLGTPIYESIPLLSASQRMIENEDVVNACLEHVAGQGGEEWFANRSWRQELLQVHARAAARSAPHSLVSTDEFDELLRSEFEQSRRLFESELGRAPRHLAFPWMLGTDRSLALAAQAGILAAFGVGFDYRRARRLSGPIPTFGRTKGEWLRFLPGRGRSRLLTALPRKIKGFFRHQHLAH